MRSKLPAVPSSAVRTGNGRREFIYVALAAAEVCWVTPVVIGLNQATLRHRPLCLWLGLLILLLGFFYIYRALAQANLSLRLQQALLLLVLLASIVLVVRYHVLGLQAGVTLHGVEWIKYTFERVATLPFFAAGELLATLALIYLWARGIHLARRSLSTDSVGLSFRAGIVIFIWVGLAITLVTGEDLAPYVIFFFFFALVAIALARIEEASHLPGGSQAHFSGYWMGSSVVAVGLVLLVGTAVALFFSGDSMRQLLVWLSPFFYALLALLVALALLLFALLAWLFSLIPIRWSGLGEMFQKIVDRLSGAFEGLIPPPGSEPSPAVERAFHLGGNLGLIVVLIALVLLFTWYRLRRARGGDADETRESLLSAGALARSLLDLLQAGRQRLSDLAGLASRFGPGQFLSAISIRRIYANLVRLATGAGYPRAAAQTPYEYLATLYQALPGSEAEAALITGAYVNAHYGKLPDTPEELQQIRDAWSHLQAQRAEREKEARK